MREATLERIALAVKLRMRGECLQAIGRALGSTAKNPRESARIVLEKAVLLGRITQEDYENTRRKRAWHAARIAGQNYFFALAQNLENLNRQSYVALRKKYFAGTNYVSAAACTHEQQCIDDLVKHKYLGQESADCLIWLFRRLIMSRLSINQLRDFAADAGTIGMHLDELALKYGLRDRIDEHAVKIAGRYVKFVIKLGLLRQDDYEKKVFDGRKTNPGRPGRKHVGDAGYESRIMPATL